MRNFLLKTIVFLPILAFSKAPDIENLPWIEAKDTEAAFYAKPFLPNNPVIIEAGAHNGSDTKRFKTIWPEATIYGFEPLCANYRKALKNTKNLNDVKLYNKVLFNYTGKIPFNRSKKNPGASSVLEDNLQSVEWPFETPRPPIEELCYQDDPHQINADCISINDWAASEKILHVDYIWLDTEGAELYIFEAATLILPTVSVISVEVNFQEFRKGMTQFSDLYDFMIKNGFCLKYIWGNPKWQAVGVFIKADLFQ